MFKRETYCQVYPHSFRGSGYLAETPNIIIIRAVRAASRCQAVRCAAQPDSCLLILCQKAIDDRASGD